ncbi:unnamed protein product [Trichogramma brassicae]|uniref:Uncharacterized protein n=1 Tax=Trichogramma brassicae TaxID=86971 RepID=A0A6H5IRK7_9HYME|nr:unnamed protein product [Trichogramma brassicae]
MKVQPKKRTLKFHFFGENNEGKAHQWKINRGAFRTSFCHTLHACAHEGEDYTHREHAEPVTKHSNASCFLFFHIRARCALYTRGNYPLTVCSRGQKKISPRKRAIRTLVMRVRYISRQSEHVLNPELWCIGRVYREPSSIYRQKSCSICSLWSKEIYKRGNRDQNLN